MLALSALAFAEPPSAGDPEKLRALVGEEANAQKASTASQERIDGVDDETQKMLAEYREVTAEITSLKTYNEQIAAQIPSQREELELVQTQLQEIEQTSREVMPLIQRMLDTLGEFVALDLPFLPEERRERVAKLEEVMNRANVTISEKYRRVVEAYQIEMEYGRTIEAYEGQIGTGDEARTVQFLRVGRVALLYQTLDQKETGYWDADKKAWVVDDDYKHAFAKGLAVAKKMGAPDLLVVPVPAPKKVES
jgi:chromosome segregation ATPase